MYKNITLAWKWTEKYLIHFFSIFYTVPGENQDFKFTTITGKRKRSFRK